MRLDRKLLRSNAPAENPKFTPASDPLHRAKRPRESPVISIPRSDASGRSVPPGSYRMTDTSTLIAAFGTAYPISETTTKDAETRIIRCASDLNVDSRLYITFSLNNRRYLPACYSNWIFRKLELDRTTTEKKSALRRLEFVNPTCVQHLENDNCSHIQMTCRLIDRQASTMRAHASQ